MENLRERYFGPLFELMSHDKVSDTLLECSLDFQGLSVAYEGSYVYVISFSDRCDAKVELL